MVLDDCGYANSGHVFSDIFRVQREAYLHVNGRVLAHSIVQVFAGMIGKPVFNVLNALAVCGLVYMLCKTADNEFRVGNVVLLMISVFLVWFCYPDQYVTMFMIAGSLNYVWATVIVLIFLKAFFSPLLNETNGRVIGLCIYSFVAGAWGEMYSVCVAPSLLLVMCLDKLRRNRVAWLMLLFFFIGTAIMVLAPGNYARMLEVNDGGSTSISTRIVNTMVNVLGGNLPWLWVLMIALWIYIRKYKGIIGFWRNNVFWWVAILFSLVFSIVSGASYQRTFFAIYTFTFVLFLQLFSKIDLDRIAFYALCSMLLVIQAFDFWKECTVMQTQRKAVSYLCSTSPVEGCLPWTGVKATRKSISDGILSSRSDNWKNQSFAHYYGIDSFALLPGEIFDLLVLRQKENFGAEVGGYVIVPLDDGGDVEKVTLVYSEDKMYVFPKKLARLMDVCGFHLREKYYLEKKGRCGFLLKEEEGISVELTNSPDIDGFGVVETEKGRFLYYDKKYNKSGELEVCKVLPQFQ